MIVGHMVAGSYEVEVTPVRPVHLYGYPHVERLSTGVHDPLWASALYLGDEASCALFVAVDIIFVPKDLVSRARKRIRAAAGVPESHVLISATHTHSGPGTVRYLSNEGDPAVPPPDPGYLQHLEDGIVEAACKATAKSVPAEVALIFGDASCTGTNRRTPTGPSNSRLPVLVVRGKSTRAYIALMLICSMHPTVLHEDSTVVSGDFPGATRDYLKQKVAGQTCAVLHHSGASGNQSPRHVVRDTTMGEAERIGHVLGKSVERALPQAKFLDAVTIACDTAEAQLPLRTFVDESTADEALTKARERFTMLKRTHADRAEIRTAECDVFGAEETLTLARAAAEGRIEYFAQRCMPAEVQRITIGPWNFVALPGELFVEFALAIEAQAPNTFVITLANGELQGYLVTRESVEEGGYEASNALFKSPEGGEILVKTALALVKSENPSARNG